MVAVDVPVQISVLLDAHFKGALLVVGVQVGRRPDVPLTVGTVLEKLSELVAIFLRKTNLELGLYDEQARRFGAGEHPLMGQRARDVDVVSFRERHVAEWRLESALALVHENEFVAGGVLVEDVHRLGGSTECESHVVIAHNVLPSTDPIAADRELAASDVSVPQEVLVRVLDTVRDRFVDPLHQRGWMDVVRNR